jgi:quinol monooxygenase YgiN
MPGMSTPVVSIHPYFKAHPGKTEEVRTLLPALVAKTVSEEKNLGYEYTSNGDEFFCRESYVDADAFLVHLVSISPLLGALMQISDLVRLEVHGPAAELEKLREPLAAMPAAWFVYECGLQR